MTEIEIGKILGTETPFKVEVNQVVTGRTFIASITRFGKSWTARKVAEEVFGHCGLIILDVEGEYVSLREKFPFLIIGKDIPLQLETAEFMAEKVLEANISAILDLSLTDTELGKEYVDKFLRRFSFLETTARKPYLIVVEEADEFGGERGIATSTCVEVLRNIAKKGAKRGIGILLISHRPAWVSKGILSQCINKAVGRIEWPADLEVLEKYARIPHDLVERFPTLEKGQFCFAGDWVSKPIFVEVGMVKTTHLGMTPDVIPSSSKELQAVIEGLQKTLPQMIEKAKATVTPITEIRSKIENELKNKYESKIETLQRTAEERAERKYKVKIDELQGQLEKLSRSQAMQPTAPITDVLEHPIVKTRMLQLDEKARDLLTWVEREPGHTREELAARMVSSKDVVANLVDKINRVFQLDVIVDDGGRPIRYKSMLKRLFLTDVAKREIEELGRLQTDNRTKKERISELENMVQSLRATGEQNTKLSRDVENLITERDRLTERVSRKDLEMKDLKDQNEALVKENEAFQKIKEGFQALGITAPSVDEEKLNALVENKVKEVASSIAIIPQVDEKKIEAMIAQKVSAARLTEQKVEGAGGVIPTSVELEHKVTHFEFQRPEEHFKADTTTLQGRLIFLVLKGFFDVRHKRSEISEELSNNGWVHSDQDVDKELLELCGKGIFYRKLSTGNYIWYSLQPEAKERIHA